MVFWQEIILLCLTVLLPITPSWVMYKQFGKQNFSKYTGVNKSVQLGGPIAAYFAIMMSVFYFTADLDPDLINWINLQQEQNSKFVGEWVMVSRIDDPETGESKSVQGKAYVRLNSLSPCDNLIINGVWQDENGDIVGSWSADQLLANDKKLVFLWNVSTAVDQITGVGYLNTTYDRNSNLVELRGNWGAIGRTQHGMVLWVRDRTL